MKWTKTTEKLPRALVVNTFTTVENGTEYLIIEKYRTYLKTRQTEVQYRNHVEPCNSVLDGVRLVEKVEGIS